MRFLLALFFFTASFEVQAQTIRAFIFCEAKETFDGYRYEVGVSKAEDHLNLYFFLRDEKMDDRRLLYSEQVSKKNRTYRNENETMQLRLYWKRLEWKASFSINVNRPRPNAKNLKLEMKVQEMNCWFNDSRKVIF